MPNKTITYDRCGFRIGGRRRILLCGTIAYFRLAREDWESRLRLFRDSGFNTVDVYVPWNYHEMEEGRFDFTTENRDLAAYLRLCHELGLMVYFRPGPYICNEWDGGGLPAWLFLKPEVRLRQPEPNYLGFVRRYLSHINEIVQPMLYTNGGAIILYALENELDFFPCEDPAAYITALRDQVLSDGIDVPLTACIGERIKVQEATGLVENVLPSPNIYVGKLIEREAAIALRTVAESRFLDGKPMSDVPPFVTEMGRDENSLKRVLSVGFKGLGPFNFAGGSNWGHWNAINNWNQLSFVSTSVDFNGMIGFDGRVLPAYWGARRVAGLVSAFEEALALAAPVTSWEGGPSCDNPALGALEDADRAGRLYSLVGHDGSTFVFLVNDTAEPQEVHVTVGDQTFPRASTLIVSPKTTPVVTANLDLNHAGVPAMIAYSTAEIGRLTPSADGAELLVYGTLGSEGELCLTSTDEIHVMDKSDVIRLADGGADARQITLVIPFDQPVLARITVGTRTLKVIGLEREAAARNGVALPPASLTPAVPQDLLTQEWQVSPSVAPNFTSDWNGEGRSLEELGVLQGAGWYEATFQTTTEIAVLSLSQASDLLTVFVDGEYCGTWLGDGGPLPISLPTPLPAGQHRLRVRAEIWGHTNFHDARWPATVIGSLRGVLGPVLLDGVSHHAQWRFSPQRDIPTDSGAELVSGSLLAADPGVSRVFRTRLAVQADHGVVLALDGKDCHGDMRVGGQVIGRCLFGPSLPKRLVGGPADRFYVPPHLLAGEVDLEITLFGIGQGGGLHVVSMAS